MKVTADDLPSLRDNVESAASVAVDRIRRDRSAPLELLRIMKFKQFGRHPTNSRDLNLIEQINQTFTYLTSIRAAEVLFELHPEISELTLNLGTYSGSDIECPRKTLAAEVFAAVNPRNNRKLARDIAKVSRRSDVSYRYVFFNAPTHVDEGIVETGPLFDVQVRSVIF